jgi:hypothetical protein
MNNSLSTRLLVMFGASFMAMLVVACSDSDPDVLVRPVPETATARPAATTPPDDGTAEPDEEEPVDLPFAPTNRIGGGLLVAEYLAGGLANIEQCLPELVTDWELEPIESDRCLLGDIDGDDRDELIYLVSVSGEPAAPGDVWFFDDADESYRLFTSARAVANEILAGVVIEALVDLTGDGAPEAVISSQNCDGDICTTSFVIASAHRGFEVENLAPDELTVASTEGLSFEDATGDQLTDLQVRREADADDRATGPQRSSSLVASWTGLRFRVDEESDEPEYLFHLVTDADDAYRSGDLELASQLYLQAATDVSLRDWKLEQGERAGREELQPYSLFRAALAAQRSGDTAAVLSLLERAVNSSSIHGLAAGVYLTTLRNGESAGSACAATESYLVNLSSFHVGAWDYGYANPTHEIDALCR